MKIIDIIKKHEEQKKPFYSFEYFPPKTDKGVENLFERLDRMSDLKPAWIDVTWGAGGSTSKLTLDICANAQKVCGLETMMHLTCTNMPREEIKQALKQSREDGIQNILALRGDPPKGEEWQAIEGGFEYAADLVKFIREEHGSYFGIAVAGYPEKHLDAVSYEIDLQNLKKKIDAGADLIVTQLFYDVKLFNKFVQDCRAIGIQCPIVPGIMPIHGFAGFMRMTQLCKTYVPQEVLNDLEPIKNDDEAVKNYGVKLAIQMCRELMETGTRSLHFYTLNLEKSVLQILEGLALIESDVRRPLPWRAGPNRTKEDVRPIFWANRPKSYLQRTATWDEFPNGRWGDSRSPAFGELTDYHVTSLHVTKDPVEKKAAWGEDLTGAQSVFDIFARYCMGDINRLPWCDVSPALETEAIKDALVRINKQGFLTINSQPSVNGAPSNHERFGWGPKNGFVYQKGYVEFFVSPDQMKRLLEALKQYPYLTYHAVNTKGESLSNAPSGANAVTWGVFPGKEIIQPTVVESDSFFVWKDEAFALWKSQWLSLYEEGSKSSQIVADIYNNFFLMNIVDNNFISGDVFAVFNDVVKASS